MFLANKYFLSLPLLSCIQMDRPRNSDGVRQKVAEAGSCNFPKASCEFPMQNITAEMCTRPSEPRPRRDRVVENFVRDETASTSRDRLETDTFRPRPYPCITGVKNFNFGPIFSKISFVNPNFATQPPTLRETGNK